MGVRGLFFLARAHGPFFLFQPPPTDLGWALYGVALGIITAVACAGCFCSAKFVEDNNDNTNEGCNCMGRLWGTAFVAMYLAGLIQIASDCVFGWTGDDGDLERTWILCESW